MLMHTVCSSHIFRILSSQDKTRFSERWKSMSFIGRQ